MESTSKNPDYIEVTRSKFDNMKNPLNYNINKINDILELFDKTTSALLNPIKKLKISYNMRINSFKGKYENVLSSVRSKILLLEKNKNSKEIKNFNGQFIEETSMQNTEISKEHLKLMNLLEECLESISTLNNLFETDEFQRLDDITKNLNSTKKKPKIPMLDLKEDDNANLEERNFKNSRSHNDKSNNSKQNNFKNKNIKNKFNNYNDLFAKKNGNSKGSLNRRNNNINGRNHLSKNGKDHNNDMYDKRVNVESMSVEIDSDRNLNEVTNFKDNKNGRKLGNLEIKNSKGKINLNNHNESEEENENHEDSQENKDDSKMRKLTDEECLEKMKEFYSDYKGLTKTFITRKLKKRIMILRKIDYTNEETFLSIEGTIPKKSGPNSFVKVTFEICDKNDFALNSTLMYYLKDLFNTYYIFMKKKDGKMRFVIAGHITKDIIFFLKKISNEEFRNKFSVQTAKIKAYAFYEELIFELNNKENVDQKKINHDEIKEYIEQYNYLEKMRKSYEEIKKIKVEK